MKTPHTLNDFREHPLVADVSDERGRGRDPGDGIWVYLVSGYCWGEVHSLHEDTVTELRRAWQDVTPCVCAECAGVGEYGGCAIPATQHHGE